MHSCATPRTRHTRPGRRCIRQRLAWPVPKPTRRSRDGEKLHEELALDAETIRESRHPDIRIWGLATPEPAWVEAMLESLEPSRLGRDGAVVAELVRGLVPERPTAAHAA